jgi:hypothetical protein
MILQNCTKSHILSNIPHFRKLRHGGHLYHSKNHRYPELVSGSPTTEDKTSTKNQPKILDISNRSNLNYKIFPMTSIISQTLRVQKITIGIATIAFAGLLYLLFTTDPFSASYYLWIFFGGLVVFFAAV